MTLESTAVAATDTSISRDWLAIDFPMQTVEVDVGAVENESEIAKNDIEIVESNTKTIEHEESMADKHNCSRSY